MLAVCTVALSLAAQAEDASAQFTDEDLKQEAATHAICWVVNGRSMSAVRPLLCCSSAMTLRVFASFGIRGATKPGPDPVYSCYSLEVNPHGTSADVAALRARVH